uniref:Ninjurin 1 n=1 Tax=Lynx canadensis TaxID=61383 RepID=A0A667HEA1_LYNCA
NSAFPATCQQSGVGSVRTTVCCCTGPCAQACPDPGGHCRVPAQLRAAQSRTEAPTTCPGFSSLSLELGQRQLLHRPGYGPSRWGRNRPINVNHYANKKSAAESMLDIALLMANASQLKAVIEQGPGFAFFVPLVVLISISLVLQIGVGVLLIFLVRYDLNNPAKHAKLDFLNNLATGLVFIIVVVNIFITAFGVQKPVMDAAPRQ